MRDLRLELRCRNNVLWHAIFDCFPSVSAFCRAHQLSGSDVGLLLNRKATPYGKHGPVLLARRLAEITGYSVETLFPPDLYAGVIPACAVAEVESGRFLPLGAAQHLTLPPSQEDQLLAKERSELIDAALRALPSRQQQVIRSRFGLGDGEAREYSLVATDIGVSCERVRQIEAQAMRKLRRAVGMVEYA